MAEREAFREARNPTELRNTVVKALKLKPIGFYEKLEKRTYGDTHKRVTLATHITRTV